MSSSASLVSASATTTSPSSADLASSTLPSRFPSFSGSFPTAPSQTGSGSSDDSNNNANNNSNTSSSLYLFTFLATLLLLLAVSCAIILRSLIIRRRYQRRVQEALAAGIILPPAPHQRRRDFGEKPKLWDAHANAPEPLGLGGEGWHGLMPVSVRIIHDKLSGAGQKLVSTPTRPTFMQTASAHLTRANRWRPAFFRSHARDRTSSPTQSTFSPNPGTPALGNEMTAPTSTTEKAVTEDAKLQVNVLIAMPSPYKPRAWEEATVGKGKTRSSSHSENDNEEEVPDVVFGSVELAWRVAVEQSAAANTDQPLPSNIQ